METGATASSSSIDCCPDWAGHLEPGVVQLIGSCLDHPYVPGAVHLSSICRAWRTAAQQTPNLRLTWHSRVLLPDEVVDDRQQQVLLTFAPWMSHMARQLISVEIVSKEFRGRADVLPVYLVLDTKATSAAAAGDALPLQRLSLPFTRARSLLPPASLVAALPFLRHLSVPLDTWAGRDLPEEEAAFLEALGSLHRLSSLEVGLRTNSPFVPQEEIVECWEQLLEAAPKQLQQLSVRLVDCPDEDVPIQEVSYTCEPLAAFKQLQRLQLGDVSPGCDLSPLAALPSLTSLGIKQNQKPAFFKPLVEVKEQLQDLQMEWHYAEDEGDFKQLTRLTGLTMKGLLFVADPLPQQVAAGLQRLDWTLYENKKFHCGGGSCSSSDGDNSSACGPPAGQELAKCSTSRLQQLHLRGAAWAKDAAAAAGVVRQFTGLTSFGFHCMREGGEPATNLGSWPSQPPMQHMKQLRRLAVPVELLVTDQPWLGGLPHLTVLQLAVEWSALTPAGAWGPEQVFGSSEAKVLANLTSCCSTLKVVEVELVLLYGKEQVQADVLPLVPAVKAWFKRQLPGVYTVLTWHADVDVEFDPYYHQDDDWYDEEGPDGQ